MDDRTHLQACTVKSWATACPLRPVSRQEPVRRRTRLTPGLAARGRAVWSPRLPTSRAGGIDLRFVAVVAATAGNRSGLRQDGQAASVGRWEGFPPGRDTMQHRAMAVMARKMAAMMALDGRLSVEGLAGMADDESAATAPARSISDGREKPGRNACRPTTPKGKNRDVAPLRPTIPIAPPACDAGAGMGAEPVRFPSRRMAQSSGPEPVTVRSSVGSTEVTSMRIAAAGRRPVPPVRPTPVAPSHRKALACATVISQG